MERIREEMPWLTEAEARKMLSERGEGSSRRGLNNMTEKELRKEAARQNVAVKNLTKKNNIIQAIRTKNAESHLTIAQKKRVLKSAMASKGLLTREGVSGVLKGKNFKNLSRANVSKAQAEVRAKSPPKTSPPSPKHVKIYYPKASHGKVVIPPKFNLRNENLNLPLNELAGRVNRPRVSPPRPFGKIIKAVSSPKPARVALGTLLHRALTGTVEHKVRNPQMLPKKVVAARDYQLRVVEAIKKMPGLIAVHSIGSGKTLTAILCAKELLKNGTVNQVIVITQKTLVQSFLGELAKHGAPSVFTLFGYKEFVNFSKGKPADFLKDAFVIIDEIHEFRSAEERFEATFRVVKHAKKVLGLTATPIVNRIEDLENQVRLVNKGAFVDSSDPSIGKYFSFYERNLNDPDFPRLNVYEVQIPMTMTYFSRWAQMGESEFHHIKRQNILDTLDAHDDNSKFAWAINKVKSIVAAGGKVIVYSAFVKRGLRRFMRQLDDLRIGYTFIEGEVPPKARRQAMLDYNSGTKPVILLSAAGGQGIDLQETTAVIIIEPPWHPSGVYQVIGRGVRFGSHSDLPESLRKVDAYLLEAVPSGPYDPNLLTDKKMYDRFVWTKQDQVTRAFESMTPYSIEGKLLVPSFPKIRYHVARNAENLSPLINKAIAKRPNFKRMVNLAKTPEQKAKIAEFARKIVGA